MLQKMDIVTTVTNQTDEAIIIQELCDNIMGGRTPYQGSQLEALKEAVADKDNRFSIRVETEPSEKTQRGIKRMIEKVISEGLDPSDVKAYTISAELDPEKMGPEDDGGLGALLQSLMGMGARRPRNSDHEGEHKHDCANCPILDICPLEPAEQYKKQQEGIDSLSKLDITDRRGRMN